MKKKISWSQQISQQMSFYEVSLGKTCRRQLAETPLPRESGLVAAETSWTPGPCGLPELWAAAQQWWRHVGNNLPLILVPGGRVSSRVCCASALSTALPGPPLPSCHPAYLCDTTALSWDSCSHSTADILSWVVLRARLYCDLCLVVSLASARWIPLVSPVMTTKNVPRHFHRCPGANSLPREEGWNSCTA